MLDKLCAKKLIETIEALKTSKVKWKVDVRIKQFVKMRQKSSNELFKELCFCILCANFTAERSLKIQNEIGDEFLKLSEEKLAQKLRALGHRFPNTRAKYIVEARKHAGSLKTALFSCSDSYKLREWLVTEVKGVGLKEASHFLRNIGYMDFAILDFHIINVLVKYKLIDKPKTLTKRKYLEIERLLKTLAENLNLNLAELDLYLWYMETGKVLK